MKFRFRTHTSVNTISFLPPLQFVEDSLTVDILVLDIKRIPDVLATPVLSTIEERVIYKNDTTPEISQYTIPTGHRTQEEIFGFEHPNQSYIEEEFASSEIRKMDWSNCISTTKIVIEETKHNILKNDNPCSSEYTQCTQIKLSEALWQEDSLEMLLEQEENSISIWNNLGILLRPIDNPMPNYLNLYSRPLDMPQRTSSIVPIDDMYGQYEQGSIFEKLEVKSSLDELEMPLACFQVPKISTFIPELEYILPGESDLSVGHVVGEEVIWKSQTTFSQSLEEIEEINIQSNSITPSLSFSEYIACLVGLQKYSMTSKEAEMLSHIPIRLVVDTPPLININPFGKEINCMGDMMEEVIAGEQIGLPVISRYMKLIQWDYENRLQDRKGFRKYAALLPSFEENHSTKGLLLKYKAMKDILPSIAQFTANQ